VSRLAGRLAGILVFVAISMSCLEVALRAAPGAFVPLGMLKHFRAEPRLEIAERLGLNNLSQVHELPRDDDGPALWLPKPNAPVSFPTAQGMGMARMDPQGFCNAPRDSYERERIELFALGDSFTACLVEDMTATWTSQLGQESGLAVYNLGRGGIGPYEYLQILKSYGLAKRPRYVVMNFYEGNDLRDADRYQQVAAQNRAGERSLAVAHDRDEAPFDFQAWLDNPLGRRSYAVNLAAVALGQGIDAVRKAVGRLTGSAPANETVEFRYDFHFDDGTRMPFNVENSDQSEVRYARKLRDGLVSLDSLDGALERYAALAREHGFTPVLSYTPSAYTAYAPFVRFQDPELAELMPWFHAEQRRYLKERSRELGLVFVDLTPALQDAARERQTSDMLYDPANVHCTTSGHRVQAQALARAIAALEG
jgi:hypothetical protein